MHPLERQEQFEMEVLDWLNTVRLLGSLVFGGGTMLRLCHEQPRYSVDLDFYFSQNINHEAFFNKLASTLARRYTISDRQNKYNTILVEIAKVGPPRKLKIEVNKKRIIPNPKPLIAFSPASNLQVLVQTIPLSQMLRLKATALVDCKEIRDAFDLDFLLRKGLSFPSDKALKEAALKIIKDFKDHDFKVKLGSVLPADIRKFTIEDRFSFLMDKLSK